MNKHISTRQMARWAIYSLFLLASFGQLHAQPAGFSNQLFVGGFSSAVGLTFDNNNRMYVWEKNGKVWIVENGVKLPNPLIDLGQEVGDWRDFGLLGFALDPGFLSNGYIYLCYTVDRHHLLHFGTPQYNPGTNEYFNATIGRVTRYTAQSTTNFTTVDYNSRLVLIGETKQTGIPSLHESHGIGQIVFGEDGTLLVCAGDGASYGSTDVGSAGETYYQQALTDGIITSAENIGAYRCQSLNSHNGKILRIDPATGNGLPSNPHFNATTPRSPASRTWARGVRNPYRMVHKPETGSHFPADGDPGIFYFGDVGWATKEELNVITQGGQNFGWPRFEGMTDQPGYNNNTYAPAVHTRPIVDWRAGTARGLLNGTIYNVGSAQVGGTSFTGNASTGGVWYTGTDFPAAYQNTYFHADYGAGWIRQVVVNANNQPTAVQPFINVAGAVVFVGSSPITGGLYFVSYPDQIRRVVYNNNANNDPTAIASADVYYGSGPLTVQFTGNESGDPDNNTLSFLWNFGDGNTSTQVNPVHTYTPAVTSPVAYTVTLTVSDGVGGSHQTTLKLSANNTPPVINATSIDNTNTFDPINNTTLTLNATVTDAESINSALLYEWKTFLMHDGHDHQEAVNNNAATTTLLSPIGCNGVTYWYRIVLKVTDPSGLSTTYHKDIYPNCSSGTNQTITFNTIADRLYNSAPFTINPVASSGLSVSSFVLEGPAVIVNNTITLTGDPGKVTVRAVQGGNSSFKPATPVVRTFFVHPRTISTQSINFPVIADKASNDPPFNLNATATSGLAVNYVRRSGPATLNGNTVTLTGTAGTVTIGAYQPGDLTRYPAPKVDRSFNVGAAPCPDADSDGVCQANDCDDNNPAIPTTPGTACNDNNAATTNDVIQANGCTCAGTPVVTVDCSGVSIVGGTGSITISGLSTPVAQVQVFSPTWATSFNCSGNCSMPVQNITGLTAGTYFVKVKLYTGSWSPICEVTNYIVVGGGGGCTDNDGDGICLPQDCNDNNPALPATPGTACNDNNANTTNDVIQADGCTCTGTPTGGTTDCSAVSITTAASSITVTGLSSPVTQVQIFSPTWATVLSCAGNCTNPTTVVNNLTAGTHFVRVRLYTANWVPICTVEQSIIVGAGPCTDNDNDGICQPQDCDDNNAALPTTPGTPCNDNNANTTNDVIQANGCTCAGTPTGGGGGTPIACNLSYTSTPTSITITGLTAPINIIKLFSPAWATLYNCVGNCTNPLTISGLSAGVHHLSIGTYNASWQPICNGTVPIPIGGGTPLVNEEDNYLYFNAALDMLEVQMDWVSNAMEETDYFEVEKSINGLDFEVLDQVMELDREALSYRDKQPSSGLQFYRVKQTFLDGSHRYSREVPIYIEAKLDDFLVFPNPAKTKVFLSLSSIVGQKADIEMYNSLGVSVLRRELEAVVEDMYEIDLADIQNGWYTIVVKVDGKKPMVRPLVVSRLY